MSLTPVTHVATTREFLTTLSQSAYIWPMLLGVPAVATLVSMISGRVHERSPWRFVYSVLVYAACVPGIFSAVLMAYMVGFARENILDAPLATTIGPVIAMIVTLGMLSRRAHFRDLPGFDRLGGLMLTLAMTAIFGLLIAKTHFMVMFRGSFIQLVVLCVVVFLGMQYGFRLMFRRKEEPTAY